MHFPGWKRIAGVGLLLIFCACHGGKEPAVPAARQIVAARASEAVTVDGLLDEPVWQSARTVTLRENRTGRLVANRAVQTQVKTCYDETALYVAFVCNDPDIWSTFTERDQHLWEEEVVEVFLDTDREPDTYVEIEVSPANVQFDSYIVDPLNIDIAATKKYDLRGLRTAVSRAGTLNRKEDRDTAWTVEIAIPLAEVLPPGHRVVPGETAWKINFYRVNADTGAESVGYAWSPTGARFHKPSVFGTLLFAK